MDWSYNWECEYTILCFFFLSLSLLAPSLQGLIIFLNFAFINTLFFDLTYIDFMEFVSQTA